VILVIAESMSTICGWQVTKSDEMSALTMLCAIPDMNLVVLLVSSLNVNVSIDIKGIILIIIK
jgi:hypothetical protein